MATHAVIQISKEIATLTPDVHRSLKLSNAMKRKLFQEIVTLIKDYNGTILKKDIFNISGVEMNVYRVSVLARFSYGNANRISQILESAGCTFVIKSLECRV